MLGKKSRGCLTRAGVLHMEKYSNSVPWDCQKRHHGSDHV